MKLKHARIMLIAASVTAGGCRDEHDFRKEVHTGAAALACVERWAKPGRRLPPLRVHVYDGGNWNGSTRYLVAELESVDASFELVDYLGGPKRSDFEPWRGSPLRIDHEGPAFYSAELRAFPWDIDSVVGGVGHRTTSGDNRRLTTFVVDLERTRVYYHYESGGFPTQTRHATPASP